MHGSGTTPTYTPTNSPTRTPTNTPTWTPTYTPTRWPTPTPYIFPTAAPRCDSSYPGVCIPPPPPDLDCPEIPYRNFTVRPPDPHGFDGDHDGVGCET